jgi:8-oxo-dGTP diphosphatase
MPHIHHLYDFTVGLFIIHDQKILLIEHPRYGGWMAPGGHIELDEDPEQAVIREALEETGLEVEFLHPVDGTPDEFGSKKLPVPQFVETHFANPPHKHISLQYVLKSKSKKSKLSDEHTAMKWFSVEDLNKNEIGLVAIQIDSYLAAIEMSK